MKYCGHYEALRPYDVGDVVLFSDDISYHLQKPAPAGTGCHDTLYWERMPEPVNEMIILLDDMLTSLWSKIGEVEQSVPTNVGESSIILKSTDETSEAEYLVTIDESGEEPEVVATLIEDDSEDTPEDNSQGGES